MKSSGGKSLTVFVVLSMTMIVAYTVVQVWFIRAFDIIFPQWLTAGWYAYWGSEIFLTARIKNVNTKSIYNKMTECDDAASDSDDALE